MRQAGCEGRAVIKHKLLLALRAAQLLPAGTQKTDASASAGAAVVLQRLNQPRSSSKQDPFRTGSRISRSEACSAHLKASALSQKASVCSSSAGKSNSLPSHTDCSAPPGMAPTVRNVSCTTQRWTAVQLNANSFQRRRISPYMHVVTKGQVDLGQSLLKRTSGSYRT